MTDEQTLSLVLKEEAGNYFLVPQEALELGRVAEEHKAEIERLVAEAATQDDVSGHAIMIGGYWWSEPGDTHFTEMPRPVSLEPPRIPGYLPAPRVPRRPRK